MMASGKGYDWPKSATTLLINFYEEHPCLYLPTHEDYHNRDKRNRALQEIAAEFNKQKVTKLTPEDIKKKIHGIRTQFLSEVNKIKKSEVSGTSTDTVYKPKLWCFDLLQFLQQGTEVVSQGESNMATEFSRAEETFSQEYHYDEPECEIIYDGNIQDVSMVEGEQFLPSESRASSSRGTSTPEQPPKKRARRKVIERDDISGLLTTAVSTLEKINKPKEDANKKHSIFGKMVAEELNSIEDEDILDEVKQCILQSIFSAKKRQRERNNL